MITFIDQVRKSKIPHPTQKPFLLSKWEKAFNSVGNRTEDDYHLYEAGIWIFKQFEKIRSKLKKISLSSLPKKSAIRLFCGDMNRTLNVISKKSPPTIDDKTIISEQLIQAKVTGNIIGPDYNPDGLLTSELDGARYPLISILNAEKKNSGSKILDDLEVLRRMKLMMLFGQHYSILEDVWVDCLWNHLKIDQKNEIVVLYRNDEFIEKARAVSEFREQSLALQSVSMTLSLWKSELSDEIKQNLAQRFKVKVFGSGKNRKYRLRLCDYDPNYPPETLVYRLLAQEAYFDELLKLEMPGFSNLTLEHLLSSWEILFALSESLMERFPKDDSVYSTKKLSQFAPSVKKKDLIRIISEGLGITFELSSTIVNLFTFKPIPKCEIWTHPLIEADSKSIIPIFTAIVSSNLLRAIEYWLKTSGIDFGSKGYLFEKEVRASLNRAIVRSKTIKNCMVRSENISFSHNKRSEELDIVIKFGNHLLIGEAKCIIYPTDPLEYFNYFKTLNHGAEQIKRKCQFVSDNLIAFMGLIDDKEYELEKINVIPFVITNRSLGVGFNIDSVPIIDQFILNRFFGEGEWEKFVTFKHNGSRSVGEVERFYETEEEALKNVLKYLSDPPQINFFKKFITVNKHPLPYIDKDSQKALFLKSEVEFPMPDSKLI